MVDSRLEAVIREHFAEVMPGHEVVFAPGFGENVPVEDLDSLVASLGKVRQRVSGPFGWFWRWWYRPRRV